MALALNAMGDKFQALLDITIVHPTVSPSFTHENARGACDAWWCACTACPSRTNSSTATTPRTRLYRERFLNGAADLARQGRADQRLAQPVRSQGLSPLQRYRHREWSPGPRHLHAP